MGREVADVLSAEEAEALRRFTGDLRRACGEALVEIRLYGRRLRGEGSAIDLFLIVEGDEASIRRTVMGVAAGSLEEGDVVFTPVVYDRARFERMVADGISSAVEVVERGILVG